jgi:hypothetical protein
MSPTNKPELSVLAKLVIAAAIALVVFGSLWYGFTFGSIERFWSDLRGRPQGLMRFRFVLQPMMAAVLAVMDGLKDARSGRGPYFMTVLRNPRETSERGIERDRQDHHHRSRHGRDLPGQCAKDVLSERGPRCSAAACLSSVLDHPRPGCSYLAHSRRSRLLTLAPAKGRRRPQPRSRGLKGAGAVPRLRALTKSLEIDAEQICSNARNPDGTRTVMTVGCPPPLADARAPRLRPWRKTPFQRQRP